MLSFYDCPSRVALHTPGRVCQCHIPASLMVIFLALLALEQECVWRISGKLIASCETDRSWICKEPVSPTGCLVVDKDYTPIHHLCSAISHSICLEIGTTWELESICSREAMLACFLMSTLSKLTGVRRLPKVGTKTCGLIPNKCFHWFAFSTTAWRAPIDMTVTISRQVRDRTKVGDRPSLRKIGIDAPWKMSLKIIDESWQIQTGNP